MEVKKLAVFFFSWYRILLGQFSIASPFRIWWSWNVQAFYTLLSCYGAFLVQERIGDVAYRLQLPAKAKIHKVIHVALLKIIRNPPWGSVPLPPLLHGRVLTMPLKVVHMRLNKGTLELLVQWVGCAAADATWAKFDGKVYTRSGKSG